MARLVKLLFADAAESPTLEKIVPQEYEYDVDSVVHVLCIDGLYAVKDSQGRYLRCNEHYRCYDDSLFARALRLLRITERDGTYYHGGKVVPEAEVKRVARLVRARR